MYLCAVNNILAEIMPRQERLQSATGIYHVMLRGINKQDIFEDDEDYSQFLNILHALVNRCDEQGHSLPSHCTFYAYCLMTNHVHLLIRERDEHIGESIKRALDFDDGDDSTCEYQYDNNGGLTYDSNRGINSITYDYSHHPITISRTTKMKTIYYDYTPDGRKLSSTHISYIPNGNSNIRILTRDLYVNGLILRGGKPLMWQFGGGYVELNDNGTPTSWNYYVTDHLGSTRMVVDSNDSIKENINYYPFGSEMRLENPALLTGGFSNPFRFTGKELDKLNSLNMYDFGARMYDVAGVPMWTSVDPLAEKYYNVSPYMYCEGNPVNMIDPDGMDYYFSVNGCFIRKDDKETQNVLIGSDDEGYKLLIIDGHAVQYNDFLMYASTVYGESSAYRQKDVDKELEYEMYAIASVFKRNTKAYGKNSDSAKYFRSIGDEERNRDGRMQTAIAATINAMTGGYDYSYGADMWDGAEQGMFGKEVTSAYVKRYELHMNTMGWDISDEHYKKWKTNVGKGFIAPQQRYAVKEYVNRKGKIVKNINAGKKRLKSTAVYGRTIFWNSK